MANFTVGDVVILNDVVVANLVLKPLLKQQFLQYTIGKPYEVFNHNGKMVVRNDYGNLVKVEDNWFKKLSIDEAVLAWLLFI